MDSVIKAKWIEALRSGKYKQAREVLFDGRAFCCLGVLCDLLNVPKHERGEHGGEWWFEVSGVRDCEVLPRPVAELVGITPAGDLPKKVRFGEHEVSDLAHLNDKGADFNFIADVIEKQL